MKLSDLQELMEKNPNLDTATMQESFTTAEQLRQLGFKRANFGLASPYSRTEAARERQAQVRSKTSRF
jgi:hypothetical protein